MANLISTVVNGELEASGRIITTYNTDRYQLNLRRTSGSSWWFSNDTDKLGLHLNNVGDKFYFGTNGDFYSDANGWLSTALAGKSNVGHTHDDRYYTETESDGRFQPLENQRLSTGNSVTFTNVYNNSWFRNNNINEGLYNQATGTHFYSNSVEGWAITGSGASILLEFRSNHQSTLRGYVHANTSNQIGFLNNGGSWTLRTDSSKNAFVHGTDLTINADNVGSSNIFMNDGDEGMRQIHCNSNRIGFLTQGGSWGSWCNDDGSWQTGAGVYSPIFYDSDNSGYYLDPNSTTALRTVGSWRADSAAWDGEFAGKIQYHSNNWYFQASSYWYFRNASGSNVVSIDSSGNITASGFVGNNAAQTRDKLRVWDSNQYTIGMKNGYDYGHLGNDEYAMSFQMNDDSGRGFWWGDTAHNDNQGAASLTTDGRMTIARSLSVGEGEAVTLPSSTPLYVKGSTSGADVIGVDGINGRLFTVTDDLSNSLFSVNTIAGLPVIEAFADNTVNIGKYGYATTWSTTGFVTMPNSANIYRDLFINGGRAGDFGNRLIIGTDATTYTMQDSNQRPTAYLHGAYPVLALNHTVTSNGSHGPTIQLTHHTNDKQWVIGTNGTGTRLDIGYSENTNRNPHNGIDDYNGSTFLRVDNGGNIQLGRGNGRSTWVNDTLYVGASDSGDSHMYFGEDSSGWYGLHWYWDSGHTVYLYGRNAGTDTEIMRYTTNSNAYVEWRRHFNMNNYEINYLNQIHFNDNVWFTDDGNNQYLNYKWGNGGAGGIKFVDGDNSLQGYVYGSGGGSFGLLDSNGSWKVRVDTSDVEMYGTQYGTDIYAYAFFDRNNVDYYLNPASYSRLWRTATHWAPSVGVGSSNWVNDFNATPVSSMSFGGDLSSGGPQGSWWFQQNMRHGNASNYWGTQIAWGWEDNANELWQRNVQGGSWSSWVRYINTNNYAGILDARYYTETEVNSLLSAKQDASTAITTSNIGSQSVSYATTAGALSSMNISQFTNNSGYITGYTETDTLATVTGRGATTSTAITLSGGSGTTPTLALDRNIATPSNYYNGLQLEVRATSGTAGIGLHRNGYSHVGIYHDSANELKFNMNAGTPILPATAGTIWGSGNDGSGSGLDADLVDGYHVSVAGTANTIPTRNASGYLIPENWIQLNGIYGLYSPTNNAHLRPNPNSFGPWLVTGTRNGWSGIEFDANNGQVNLMINPNSNTSGFHNNSYGWQFYWENGTLYCNKSSYGGGTSATVLDSSNAPYAWNMNQYVRTTDSVRFNSLGVNVAASATAGRIDAGNDIVAYSSSDERLKENITPIENALEKVLSLTGVEFDWKPEYKDAHGYEGHDTGVIAQQVQEIIPSAVRTNQTGFLAVRYEKLIGLLIEAMKEQQLQIEELRSKLK
jgi:hypothetical protein